MIRHEEIMRLGVEEAKRTVTYTFHTLTGGVNTQSVNADIPDMKYFN